MNYQMEFLDELSDGIPEGIPRFKFWRNLQMEFPKESSDSTPEGMPGIPDGIPTHPQLRFLEKSP